jgi:hypothetical protein
VPALGRFLSQDPLAVDFGLGESVGYGTGDVNVYRYASNHPSETIDPSGLIAVPMTVPHFLLELSARLSKSTLTIDPHDPSRGTYGAFGWGIIFRLSKPADPVLGGWVLQHVSYSWEIFKDSGKTQKFDPPELVDPKNGDFWEAFRISPKQSTGSSNYILPDFAKAAFQSIVARGGNAANLKKTSNDWFFYAGAPIPSCGFIRSDSQAYYVDAVDYGTMVNPPNAPFKKGGVKTAGNLPAFPSQDIKSFTKIKPYLQKAQGFAVRFIKASWMFNGRTVLEWSPKKK